MLGFHGDLASKYSCLSLDTHEALDALMVFFLVFKAKP